MVSDQELPAAYKPMAQSEGIFCESASAGLLKLSADDLNLKGKKAGSMITGTDLKTPTWQRLGTSSLDEHAAELSNVKRAMALV